MNPRRTLLVGLGNPILTDDGVGWHVVSAVREKMAERCGVEVEYSACGGLSLMEAMVGFSRVVVVDAVRTGAAPGTIHRLTTHDVPTRHSTCGHDASLSSALALGRAAGAPLPPDEDILLVGVEAADVETLGEACTPEVHAAIPSAVDAVNEALKHAGRPPWP